MTERQGERGREREKERKTEGQKDKNTKYNQKDSKGFPANCNELI